MNPYWCLVILMPTTVEANEGGKATILWGPDVLLAQDEAKARIRAARMIPAEYEDQIERITINVKPF